MSCMITRPNPAISNVSWSSSPPAATSAPTRLWRCCARRLRRYSCSAQWHGEMKPGCDADREWACARRAGGPQHMDVYLVRSHCLDCTNHQIPDGAVNSRRQRRKRCLKLYVFSSHSRAARLRDVCCHWAWTKMDTGSGDSGVLNILFIHGSTAKAGFMVSQLHYLRKCFQDSLDCVTIDYGASPFENHCICI